MKNNFLVICLIIFFFCRINDVNTAENTLYSDIPDTANSSCDFKNTKFLELSGTFGTSKDTDDCGPILPSVNVSSLNRKSPREILKECKNRKEGILAGVFSGRGSANPERLKLYEMSSLVRIIYISDSTINTPYGNEGPFNIETKFIPSKHGLEFVNYGQLWNSVKLIRKARPEIILLMGVGGEKTDVNISQEMNYIDNLVKLVKDFDLDGIHLHWLPRKGFAFLNKKEYSDYYIKLIKGLRNKMPKEYLISVASSGNGSFSCIKKNSNFCYDRISPYSIEAIKQSKNKWNINMTARSPDAGSSINIYKQVGHIIDLIYVYSYNVINTDYELITDVYLSHLYYAEKYNMVVILGFHADATRVSSFNPTNDALLELIGNLIHKKNEKNNRTDGISICYLNMDEYAVNKVVDVNKFLETMWYYINPYIEKPRLIK